MRWNQLGKYGPEKTPYLDIFHAVIIMEKFMYTMAKLIWTKTLIRVNKSGFAKVPYINRETQPLVFERKKHKAR